ncbi:MAG: glutathione S-transferase N-terminal domain-containing protein [Proteobacteria bacterium]|nr:glutathione S-transferase N-terminal domain-containing protein [Pseudomonadota bacterium]MCH9758827.1 glutathione S-transferase N-terminal domain-containing protein [Pseudomonadota bacterium]
MPITLYSYGYCPYSHRCRIVFREKEMEAHIEEVDIGAKPEELAIYNPYNQTPVLIDRSLVLYESNIINEYLDDRFPHPQLMPTDILLRAKVRLLLYKIDAEIFPALQALVLKRNLKKDRADILRQRIVAGLTELSTQLPKNYRYLIDKEFTMLDVALAPLLWRLSYYKIELPTRVATPLYKYAERVFSRPSFIESMSVVEKSMRK